MMKFNLPELMRDAVQLTRSGRLQEATDAIQRLLRKSAPPPATAPSPALAPVAAGEVIDVEAIVIDEPRHEQRPSPAPADPVSDGPGQFIAGQHTDARLTRGYKLYVPPNHAGRLLPLVVMLHGCTQDPDDFAAGTAMNVLAREQGFYVLYPAQSADANPQRCWNWFKHNHQQRGRGEPALLAGMTQAVMARHGIDARRVYVAGLSAGGAMAAIVAQAYPDVFAAAGVHSGLAAGAARDVMSALAAMKDGAATIAPVASSSRVPTIVFHGDADATVNPLNAEQVLAATLAGTQAAAHSEPGASAHGRGYTRTRHLAPDGSTLAEQWRVHGAGHAWAGGSANGSYTDPAGPDASREMLRFFLEHPRQ